MSFSSGIFFNDHTYLPDERGQNGALFTVTKTLMTLEETRRCKFISSWRRVPFFVD